LVPVVAVAAAFWKCSSVPLAAFMPEVKDSVAAVNFTVTSPSSAKAPRFLENGVGD